MDYLKDYPTIEKDLIIIHVKGLTPVLPATADLKAWKGDLWPLFRETGPFDNIIPEWILQSLYYKHNHIVPTRGEFAKITWNNSKKARQYYYDLVRYRAAHGKHEMFCGVIWRCNLHKKKLCPHCYSRRAAGKLEQYCNLYGEHYDCDEHKMKDDICTKCCVSTHRDMAITEWRVASVYQGSVDRLLRKSTLRNFTEFESAAAADDDS